MRLTRLRRQLKRRWLYAMDVPEVWAQELSWGHSGCVGPIPERCVVCGRTWRPDKPMYVTVWGRVLKGTTRLHLPALGLVVPAETECDADGPGYLCAVCTEHADRWAELTSVLTGDTVTLSPPPTRWQELWRDARYWTRTTWRFVWSLLRESVFIVTHLSRWLEWRRVMREMGLR